MPTFILDDREMTVPEGTTILQAVLDRGEPEIPHYCYHPGLSIAGNCRICLVDVEKMPKPAIACNTLVAEGMVVRTRSDKALEARKAVMEFLLINHPLDCPICDQAGECKLQDYAVRHGQGYSRFVEEKYHGPKKRELGPHVLFDWERCIKCTRCIRFTDEVTETSELDMFLRGVREEIGVFPGRPLSNDYSGNVVDICPVGALTLNEFRFRSRVWFLKDWPSVCTGCARGCSIKTGVYMNKIMRIKPRQNDAVNRWWICDEGRLSYQRLDGERLQGSPGAGDWEDALADVARALREAGGKGRAGILASPRASNEETYLLGRIAAEGLGGTPVYLPVHERGADDDLLIRADKSPNRRGAETILASVAGGARPVSELEEALEAGNIDVLLVLGPNLGGPVPDEAPPIDPLKAARAGRTIMIDAFPSPLSEVATSVLPCQHVGEQEGTVTNFAGRVQRLAAPLAPSADAWPVVALLAELAGRLDLEGSWGSAHAVFAEMAALVPDFRGLSWDGVAGTGADLEGAEGAALACRPTGATSAREKAGA